MLAATVFGVVFIPVLYVVFQNLREKAKQPKTAPAGKRRAAKNKA
jgi:hypothetical protein